jgi:uncharacterized small protein (DUF1192 family)
MDLLDREIESGQREIAWLRHRIRMLESEIATLQRRAAKKKAPKRAAKHAQNTLSE